MTSNQLEFTATNAGASQCDKILQRLRQSPGQWVAMPELVSCSQSYNIHSRVSDLRKKGLVIEQTEERDGRRVNSFYRILE